MTVRIADRLRVASSVTRIHIVAIATLGGLTFGWVFTGRHLWWVSIVVALDWFLVNLLNRVVDRVEDARNRIVGVGLVDRHARVILHGGMGLLGTSLVVVHLAMPFLTPWRLAFHTLGLAYNWPLLPGGRRIKRIYLVKNVASAIGFLLTVFAYPLAAAPRLPGVGWREVVVGAGFFFLFEISYEVIYDLRDRDGDRAAGVRTFPVVHGVRAGRALVVVLILLSMGVLAGGAAVGYVRRPLLVMIAAPALQLALFSRMAVREVTSGDCVGLTWLGVFLLATYHLWIALDLPGVGA